MPWTTRITVGPQDLISWLGGLEAIEFNVLDGEEPSPEAIRRARKVFKALDRLGVRSIAYSGLRRQVGLPDYPGGH